jgi:hypothetical protein
MSFSDIFGWIGNAASNVGSTLKDAVTGGMNLGDAKTKNPLTGAVGATEPTGWGAFLKEVTPILQKNIKFGGVPIQEPKGPGVNLLKSAKSKYKGGPALPAAPEGAKISLEDIAKFGEGYAKSKMQKQQMRDDLMKKYSTMAEDYTPDYGPQPAMDDRMTWDEYIKRYYENDWSNV